MPRERVEVTYVRTGRGVDAHALLRSVASRASGQAHVDVGHHCPHCGSADHGRPVVTAPGVGGVSLSRTPGLVCVAISARPGLGVDVELLSGRRFSGVDGVACHPDEGPESLTGLARLWVRKEAVLKACGLGLEVPLDEISIREREGGPELDAWPSRVGPRPEVTVVDFSIDRTHVGAVAVLGRGPVELRVVERPGVPLSELRVSLGARERRQ